MPRSGGHTCGPGCRLPAGMEVAFLPRARRVHRGLDMAAHRRALASLRQPRLPGGAVADARPTAITCPPNEWPVPDGAASDVLVADAWAAGDIDGATELSPISAACGLRCRSCTPARGSRCRGRQRPEPRHGVVRCSARSTAGATFEEVDGQQAIALARIGRRRLGTRARRISRGARESLWQTGIGPRSDRFRPAPGQSRQAVLGSCAWCGPVRTRFASSSSVRLRSAPVDLCDTSGPWSTMTRPRRPGALERYEAVIGIEVHCQLRTASKMFCGCSTAYDGAPPEQPRLPGLPRPARGAAGHQPPGGGARPGHGPGDRGDASRPPPAGTARTTSTRTCRRATRSASTTCRWRRSAA